MTEHLVRNLLAAGVVAACLAACSGDVPPPSAPVESADMQRVRAEAVATHRAFMTSIYGEGQALVDNCKPGAPEAVRLTYHDARWERAFTLGIVAAGKGADAVWQGLREDREHKRVVTVGVQGVRMDGNGWRQVRQSLTTPNYRSLPPEQLIAYGTRGRWDGETYRIESCLDGQYRLTTRHKPDPDRDIDLIHAAQGMMRLAGSVY
jgi:hypothetical protein